MKFPFAPLAATLFLAACGSQPPAPIDRDEVAANVPTPPVATRKPTPTRKPGAVLKRGGGFYKDDGPGEDIPDGLDDIPDAEPKWEPLHKPATRPYNVLGKDYVPNTGLQPYKARGIASWYGRKFHGQKTSIGEPYDMFAMTAAHTTLALPSYVRVTNVQNGKSVVVRVIDRGPFHADRIIDLSYTAAYKLELVNGGSGIVEVEAILPGEMTGTTYAQVTPPPKQPDLLAQFADTPPPMAASPAIPMRGIFLQLGAFANLDNAENLRTHLSRELDWLNEPMSLQAGAGVHRLQVGPYTSRNAAEQVAQRIASVLGYRPTVVLR